MTLELSNFRIHVSYRAIEANLDEDILSDEKSDWLLSSTGDWILAKGEKALDQDLIETFHLKPFEDIIDIQEGSTLYRFKNANINNNNEIEIRQALLEWLSKDDRIDPNSVEVSIERT